jgi:hypothetical protein
LENTQGGGDGIFGIGKPGRGVVGTSDNQNGVTGISGKAATTSTDGISSTGNGVWGECIGSGVGVWATSQSGEGVHAEAHARTAAAVVGINTDGGDGVFGIGNGATGRGVVGTSVNQNGVTGISTNATGVWGESSGGRAVYGYSTDQVGVYGESKNFDGVWGVANQADKAGVVGQHNTGGLSGLFNGNVHVKGTLSADVDIQLTNGDCAEDFDIGAELLLEPGTVVVLGEGGELFSSLGAYDKRVAGVISGAGEYKPGIVLDKQQKSSTKRQPVALLGKVFCKVDTEFGAIEVGDLLTTSPTPGHAMKAADQARAFGSVIGKALRSFSEGKGLIPILIALQ